MAIKREHFKKSVQKIFEPRGRGGQREGLGKLAVEWSGFLEVERRQKGSGYGVDRSVAHFGKKSPYERKNRRDGGSTNKGSRKMRLEEKGKR